MKAKNKNLRAGLLAFIAVIAIIFIVGILIYKPEPEIMQGEAEAPEIRISSKIPGRISKFSVEEGNLVHAGDTLVILESPELNAKMEQASAAEQAALAQNKKAVKGARKELITSAYEMYQKALAGVEITKKTFDRVQKLYEKGVIPAQKRDEAEAQYKAAVATANAAKSQYEMAVNGAELEDKETALALVARARGAVNEVKSYMNETVLLAPIDGEISEIYPNQGELLGSGAPIMSIVDLNKIKLVFNVRENELGSMKTGTMLKVKIPALSNRVIDAKVNYLKAMGSYATWKATKTTGQYDVKTFEVHAQPIEKIEGLLPGMSVLIENIKH